MVGVRAFLLLVFAWLFRRFSRFLGRLRIGDGKLDGSPGGRILKNLLIGLIAVLGVHFMSELPMIRKNSEGAMDWMIRMNAGTSSSHSAQSRPFVLLDIDEQSYRDWGEPLFVPRDKLLRLIRAAVEGKAAAVLVDVELSRSMGPEDTELASYLAGLGLETHTSIILARGVRRNASDSSLYEVRTSFLDSVVAQSPIVHWGSTAYALDDDGAVRRWRLWELACTSDGKKPVLIPSVQLQVLAALDSNPDLARWRAHKALAALEQKTCRRNEVVAPDVNLTLANVTLSVGDEELGRRILYSLPWKLSEGDARQTIPWRGADLPLLAVRPAYTLTADNAPSMTGQWEGRIVVIGASFADSRDSFMTPLGEMPGVLMLINTLQSVLQHGETQAPPFWLMLLFELLVILLLSLLFAYFSSFWGVIATGALVIFGMVPASFILFKEGIWLNFALPVLVVQLMQLGDEFKSLRQRIPPARQ